MQKKNYTKYSIPYNKGNNTFIIPVFMPFWACPQICVFCNQTLQTGSKASNNIENLLLEAKEKALAYTESKGKKHIELAFYGGTFSALPEEEFNYALLFLKDLKDKQIIHKARCSTRPDACQESRLIAMKKAGIDTIELGIQSFSNKALLASNRGYKGEIALDACKKVLDYGFKLGIQLMPNMPEQEITDFYKDIEKVLAIKPSFIRLYPCLVVENTPLAKMWKEGRHTVWEIEQTIDMLAFAMFKMWLNDIYVIRVGVAPEVEFYKNVLAGVHHEALGQMVQAKAFKYLITSIYKEYALKDAEIIWHFPLHAKGYIMLQKDDFWKEHAISSKSIQWHSDNELYFEKK